jgi:uncharacterized protein YdeI (YjbR/CyaY-like superfamily)
MNPKFFASPSDFRKGLEANHGKAQELWVGFYKKGSGKPSITWPEAVDQLLCYCISHTMDSFVRAFNRLIRWT